MKYNFDEEIDRTNTFSVKWDFLKLFYPDENLLPLWVADMDFKSPQPVIEALKTVAEHGVYGYSYHKTDVFFDAIKGWMFNTHNWKIESDWIQYSPGIVPAIALIIRTFSAPGEKVIINEPVYYPFRLKITNNGRLALNNDLQLEDNKYRFDIEDFKKKAEDPLARLFILCSPHNPVGRVWTQKELKAIGDICLDNNILVISDEIWHDLILPGYAHTVFPTISDDFADISITCTAPSKTFNIAGLHASNIIISNKEMREKFNHTIVNQDSLASPSPFAIAATIASYNKGKEWLDQVITYIADNFAFLQSFVKENMPKVKMIKPEGTYLAWLDFRSLGLDKDQLQDVMQKKAKVALDEGFIFGKGGEGFERINVATSRSILKECIERISSAIEKVQ